MSLVSAGFGDILTGGMVTCTRMDRTSEETPLGPIFHYSEGAKFQAYLKKDNSPEIRVAEQQGMNELYTVIVLKSTALTRDEVFKRDSDGLTFMCTSSTRDSEAPEMASLPIAKCGAKRWDIP